MAKTRAAGLAGKCEVQVQEIGVAENISIMVILWTSKVPEEQIEGLVKELT